jgi:Mg2+/Co2+ transporter CorB
VIYVWIIGLSLLVTAVFSAAEMSFIAANRLRLRHMAEGGHRTAIRYLEAFRSPERLLSTAMMGVTIAHITASSVATWASSRWWAAARPSWSPPPSPRSCSSLAR